MRLRESPHCSNCIYFNQKSHRCKKAWKGKIHPEQAGHIITKVDSQISLFEITCDNYQPKKHIQEHHTKKEYHKNPQKPIRRHNLIKRALIRYKQWKKK